MIWLGLLVSGCGTGHGFEQADRDGVPIEACVGYIGLAFVSVDLTEFAPQDGEVRLTNTAVTAGEGTLYAEKTDITRPYSEKDGQVRIGVPYACRQPGSATLSVDVEIVGELHHTTVTSTLNIRCKQCGEPACDPTAALPGVDPIEAVENPTGNLVEGSDGQTSVQAGGETDLVCVSVGTAPGDLLAQNVSPQRAAEPLPELTVVHVELDGAIPEAHPSNHYQYGFVFETNGDPADDYEPSPAYPSDFFAWTDTWVVLTWDERGWTTAVSRMDGFGNPQPSSLQAEVHRVGNHLLAVLPKDELADGGAGGFRTSAFRHQGNWMGDDWNADVVPAVDQPLIPLE